MMAKMTSQKSDYGLGYTSSGLGEPSIYKHSIAPSSSNLDVDDDSLAPYEKKAKELERREKKQGRGGGGGSGGDIDIEGLPQRLRPKGGKQFKKGGSVKSSASKRADGIAQRGKTRGRMV